MIKSFNNKLGFTLVELLAVMLILGFIALIAVPTVSKVLEDTRVASFKSSLTNVERKVSDNCSEEQLKGRELTTNYNITNGSATPSLKMQGKIPDGNIIVDSKCRTTYILSNNKYVGIKRQPDDTPTVVKKDEFKFFEVNIPKTTNIDITDESFDLLKDVNITGSNGKKVIPTITGDIDFGVPGTYPITYTYTDSLGNTETFTRDIIVKDTKKPVINAPTETHLDISVKSYDLLTDVTVTDNSGETIIPSVSGNLSLGIAGEYLITYTATDSTSNTATLKRTIIISDTEKPVITAPSPTYIDITTKSYDLMKDVTVTDNSGSKITPTVSGNLSLGIEGTYTLTYTATDSSGNSKTFERKIIITNPTIDNSPHVGYYADIDGDNIPDGIIFADLVSGAIGSGKWNDDLSDTYTIPTISENSAKKYYITNESYTGNFGTKPVLSQVSDTTGSNRFYIMALNDVSTYEYFWYYNAYGQMSDYATYTSVDFGSGNENTSKMITKWDAAGYGAQTTTGYCIDILGAIKPNVAKNWFIPSREEWAAFANELGIRSSNYTSFKLKGYYWSSSQYDTTTAWRVDFEYGYMLNLNVKGNLFARLAATF